MRRTQTQRCQINGRIPSHISPPSSLKLPPPLRICPPPVCRIVRVLTQKGSQTSEDVLGFAPAIVPVSSRARRLVVSYRAGVVWEE